MKLFGYSGETILDSEFIMAALHVSKLTTLHFHE